jgi:hypothetical protein
MADEKRPLRICDSCGQIDDHPRDVLATADGDGVTNKELLDQAMASAKNAEERQAVLNAASDGAVLTKHIDCCAAEGCASCSEILSQQGNKRGLELAKALAPKDN